MEGQKKSIPIKAPDLVVADLDIIKGAPKRLVASGINDILAKLTSEKEAIFSVQYHPESAPGPQDSRGLFDRFTELMEGFRKEA